MPNVFTNTNSFSPLGNALSSKINGKQPLGFPSSTPSVKRPSTKPNLLSGITKKASDFYYNKSIGRFHNPNSPEYIGYNPNQPKTTTTPQTPSIATTSSTTPTPDHNASRSNLVASPISATLPSPQQTRPITTTPSLPTTPTNQGTANVSAPITPPPIQPPTTPTGSATFPGGLYGRLVSNLANVGTENVTGNIKKISDLQKEYANQVAGIESSGAPLAFEQGQGQVLQNAYGQRLNAAQTGLASAVAQQGQQIGALGTAAGLAAPLGASPGTSYYNPVEGTFKNQFIGEGGGGGTIDDIVNRIGKGAQGYDQAIQSARSLGIPENVIQQRLQQMFPGFNQTASNANVLSTAGRQAAYNQGLVNLRAGDNILQGILGTFGTNPDLNRTPVTLLTNLNDLLSGQISSGPQQQLSAQVAQYINTLGLDPGLVRSLAGQARGTLWDLLQTLKQTAQSQNEANLTAGYGGAGGVGAGGGNNDPLGIR